MDERLVDDFIVKYYIPTMWKVGGKIRVMDIINILFTLSYSLCPRWHVPLVYASLPKAKLILLYDVSLLLCLIGVRVSWKIERIS